MKYQNFIMRILCLLLILAAVVGYNSMQKKDTQAQESQEITALTKRVEKLEEQNTEILSALEEAAKNQEAAMWTWTRPSPRATRPSRPCGH